MISLTKLVRVGMKELFPLWSEMDSSSGPALRSESLPVQRITLPDHRAEAEPGAGLELHTADLVRKGSVELNHRFS